MTMPPTTELRVFNELDSIRSDVVDVYAEVRAPLLHLPNYAVTAFGERLDRHGAEPRFTWGYEGRGIVKTCGSSQVAVDLHVGVDGSLRSERCGFVPVRQAV